MEIQKRFTDVFINRPVLAVVVSLVLLLIGLKSFHDLPLRQYPMLNTSVINVGVTLPGASPDLVESRITAPIEGALSGINGVDFIQSSSAQSASSVTINFKLGYDINRANTDVANAVSSIRYQLPQNIYDPVITKMDPNATPLFYIAFNTPNMTEAELGDFLTRDIKPQMSNLPDVGQVQVWSDVYAMRLWLDPHRMAARGVTATDVQNAVNNNNVQATMGQLVGDNEIFNLVGENTDLKTADAFNNLLVKLTKGQFVRLSDVGYAELGAQSYNVAAYVNGKRSSVVAITPTSNGNPLKIAVELNDLLPQMQKHLPPGMHLRMLWDSSRFIHASLVEVVETLIIAVLCVLVVIFGFLGSWRSVLIPVVTIPLSLFGVCSIMLGLGYSLNTLTFLAWVLAIGLVVDDSIVVLENISRHIEEGKSPHEAALIGAREIAFAVIAMTLTLAAVYAPIGMLTDLTGVLFREFAFTLAGTVLISGIIALTLSPMMCSTFLRPIEKESLTSKIDALFLRLRNKYQISLMLVLKHPKWIILVALIVYASAWLLYRTLPSELAPTEDQGVILIGAQANTSASFAYTQKYALGINAITSAVPEGDNTGVIVGMNGPNTAFAFFTLQPWNKRERSSTDIIGEIMPKLWANPGIQAFPFNPPALPGASGNNPISFVLKSTAPWNELEAAAAKLAGIARANPHFNNVDTDLKNDQLTLLVNVNRDKANSMNINMSDLSNSLGFLLGNPIAGYFQRTGQSYEIIPQIVDSARKNPMQLADIPIKTLTGDTVPLGSFTSFTQTAQPQSLPHFQQMRAVTLSAGVQEGYTLGEALNFLNKAVAKELPASIGVDYSGQSRQFIESQGAMAQVFLFAIIFIFLVLSAQFESFRNPLIVMLSVPLSLFGALLVMHLTHCTINIFTEVGLVTLIGLISKHAILIVEFAEQMQATGKSKFDAVFESASMRLRPILMTTAAMVLGAIPLILANGAGGEARRQLGWVIVAGMGIGTCFTIFVIPAVYDLIARETELEDIGAHDPKS